MNKNFVVNVANRYLSDEMNRDLIAAHEVVQDQVPISNMESVLFSHMLLNNKFHELLTAL